MSETDTSTSSRLTKRLEEIATTVSGMKRDSESQQMRNRIAGYGRQLNDTIAQTEGAVAQYERELATAHEDGDGSRIASIQRKLTEAVSERDMTKRKLEDHQAAVRDFENRARQEAENPTRAESATPAEPAGQVDYSNLNKWQDANKDWYGVDTALTSAAHEIDKQIRANGVISVGSPAYFEAVDRQMAQKFPDRFNKSPSSGGSGGGNGATSAGTGRIPASVVNGWRRMGINVDDPKTMERMVKNREVLAKKGILPETPQYGEVRIA